MPSTAVLIVGAGQAGYQVAASLRQGGYLGEITLVGNEPDLPYQRPPLSKAYLLGEVESVALRFRPPEFYEERQIRLVHDEVVALDPARRVVHLRTGPDLAYGHLVLATGARNRVPDLPGIDARGVWGLRSLADAGAIAAELPEARDIVVMGAGFIGLEFAAVAAARGARVRVLELGTRPMARAVSAPMSALFSAAHARCGVRISCGVGVASIETTAGKVVGVETSQGEQLPADLVVYGVGVLPNDALAAGAGLKVNNGIEVNEHLLTSDPHISAIGDVARFPSIHSGGPLRLESVQNAADQARNLAARLQGKPAPYQAMPWFWSDQGALKLQIVGLSDGHDQVVQLGDSTQDALSVLCFSAGRLCAVESVNRTADHAAARKLLGRATALTVAEAQADGFDLKAYEFASRPQPA